MIDTTVIAQLRFEALHHWPGAVDHEMAYLAFPHRHEFHIRVDISVDHDDREIEFIQLKRIIESWLQRRFGKRDGGVADLGRMSCEQLAALTCEMLSDNYAGSVRDITVEVLEDGENGAQVYFVPDIEEELEPIVLATDPIEVLGRCPVVHYVDGFVVQCVGADGHQGEHIDDKGNSWSTSSSAPDA